MDQSPHLNKCLHLISKTKSWYLKEEWRGTESNCFKSSVCSFCRLDNLGCQIICWCPLGSKPKESTKRFWSTSSADKLYGEAFFLFQQDLAPAHSAKTTTKQFAECWHALALLCFTCQPIHLTWTLQIICGVLSKERWQTPNLNIQMRWRLLSNQTELQ